MEQQPPDSIAGLDAIDPGAVDWSSVRSSRYVVRQRFSYAYPAAIHDLRQQLMVLPPAAFGDQLRTEYSIEVSEPGTVITRLDSFANTVIDVRIPVVQRAIEFEARVAIERAGPAAPRVLLPAPSPDPRLLAPTERTMPDAAIERAAADLRAHGAPGLELAERVNAWVHEAMAYVPGATSVHTTAAEALAIRGGVCQDYAHVMIAICRRLGLPALYVSGLLLGEGGTHAWVEVQLPAADGSGATHGWALDPTHGRHADLTYLTVAVGRDYGDVAPTSGHYRAGHGGSLTGLKEVRVVDVAY
jgi:transglutaminase-like putative cysteine protease